MPITDEQIADLRADVGDTNPDSEVFTVTEIQRLYTRAEGIHGSGQTTLIEAQVRVLAIKQLLASSAKLTTYKQNQSSENLSDIFKHLEKLKGMYQEELDDAASAASGGGAAWASLKKKPARKYEVPDS